MRRGKTFKCAKVSMRRDLQAAQAVDCQPVLVKTGKGERTLAKPLPPGTLVFDDLAAVADQLLS